MLYRDEINSLQIELSRTQAGPGRTGKQEKEQTSRNHVPSFQPISVKHRFIFHISTLPKSCCYTPNIKRTSTFYRDALVPNILPVMLPVTPWYGNFPKFTTLVTISMLLLGAAGTFDQNAVGLPNPIAIRSTHTNQQRTQIRPQSDFTKMHTQYTSQIENLYSKRVRICSLV